MQDIIWILELLHIFASHLRSNCCPLRCVPKEGKTSTHLEDNRPLHRHCCCLGKMALPRVYQQHGLQRLQTLAWCQRAQAGTFDALQRNRICCHACMYIIKGLNLKFPTGI